MKVWPLALALLWLSIRGHGRDEVQVALDVPPDVPDDLADYNWPVDGIAQWAPGDRVILLLVVPVVTS